MRKKTWLLLTAGLVWWLSLNAQNVTSPNGKLTAEVRGKSLVVKFDGQQVMELTDMPIAVEPKGELLRFSRMVAADYWMVAGKRRHCTNVACEYVADMKGGCQLILRLYNDGVAFRYENKGVIGGEHPAEQTVYRIPEGMRRWMQQWTDSYEGFFPQSNTYKVLPVRSYSGISKSADGWNNRWGYPALLEPVEGVFVLITEANIEKGQSASWMMNDGERFYVKPGERMSEEQADDGRSQWHSPWRVAIVGHLKDVVESTLVTDVSEPNKLADASWVKPGVVSWIYWAYNHGSNDYEIVKKYVDLAVALSLPYVLIDAEWDEMGQKSAANGNVNDVKTIVDAIAYAKEKGVKPLIWYNSSVGWIDGAPGPKFRLNKEADREREFAWCEQMGVAGVKIDFFSGDSQRNMDYCIDLLECAARHHLLVNFHGATIPRGWQRTYPNLLTTEGVYGAEWYNNVATFTTKAACHNATLPYTRNVVGSMDYTPCTFSDSQHPHITTHAHELALTVLFESGLLHLADRPESYLSQPAEVRQLLSNLPTVWDETKFVSGYPGESAVMARRSGSTWYVAGINGTDDKKWLATPLDFISTGEVTLFSDGEPWNIVQHETLPQRVECLPRGGFVIVAKEKGLK